jgi:hypothetical protein
MSIILEIIATYVVILAAIFITYLVYDTMTDEPPQFYPCGLAGDMNKDWKLDITDLSILAERIRNQNHE